MNIKILGVGCTKCKTLDKITRDAVAETGIEAANCLTGSRVALLLRTFCMIAGDFCCNMTGTAC